MKILKFAIVGLIAFGGVNAFAQEEETVATEEVTTEKEVKKNKAEHKLNKMAEELELSDEQMVKAKAIVDKFAQRRQKIKADETTTDEVKKSQMKELKKLQKEQLRAILTEQQIVKLDQLKTERKEKSLEERADAKTEKMAEKLGLTPEQKERVKVLNRKVAQKISAIKKDESMTDEKKKEFIKGNMKDHKNVMKQILTEEQFTQYEEWIKARKAKKKAKASEEISTEESAE
jgi:hypothetical protein